MQINKFFVISLLLLSCNNVQGQEAWKKKFGIWINVELDNLLKLNRPSDSTVYIMPRFLWIRNLTSIEIEQRFEQKRIYTIKSISKNK